MSDVNVFEPAWDAEAPAPWNGRMMRVAQHAGSRDLGATLYELEPGGATSPYHLHHANEEMLIVLEGRPSLRSPDGTRELAPGALVAFPPGRDGAHRIFNASAERVRLLIVSTMRFPEVAEHPDTGTVLAISDEAETLAFPRGSDRPALEAVMEAMQAADGSVQDPDD